MPKQQLPETDRAQIEKFKAMAKELEVDGDEKGFDAALKKLAKVNQQKKAGA